MGRPVAGNRTQDLLQSILEGIAMRSAEVINAMDKLKPIGDSISVDGGLSANRYFTQFLANLIQSASLRPPTKRSPLRAWRSWCAKGWAWNRRSRCSTAMK